MKQLGMWLFGLSPLFAGWAFGVFSLRQFVLLTATAVICVAAWNALRLYVLPSSVAKWMV